MTPLPFIRFLLHRNLSRQGACLICGVPTRSTGMFLPHDSTQFGCSERQTRMFIYYACSTHAPRDAVSQQQLAHALKRHVAKKEPPHADDRTS